MAKAMVIALAIAATAVASGAAPAAAQEEGGPVVTVRPSRGLRAGDVVDVEIRGGTTGALFGIYLCDSSLEVPVDDLRRLSDFCILPEASPVIHRIDGDPTVVPVPVRAYPSVPGIFGRCAVAPPGVVTIPGSHLRVHTEVRARFTSILGDPVDCTTSPDACVLVLARMERDRSLTLHATPIAFAGAGTGA